MARNEQNISQYSLNNSLAQKWIVVNTNNGYKIMSALDYDYVLDLKYGVVENSSNIDVYTSNDSQAQRWHFVKYETPRQKLDKMAREFNADIDESTYIISCSKSLIIPLMLVKVPIQMVLMFLLITKITWILQNGF